MLTSYTTLIIIDDPSYGNASCIVFHANEAYLMENLVETERGRERETREVQLDIHTHAQTHTHAQIHRQTKSTQLYLTVINNTAQQLHPV